MDDDHDTELPPAWRAAYSSIMDKLKSAEVFEGDGIGIPVAGGEATLTLKKWGSESADRPPTHGRAAQHYPHPPQPSCHTTVPTARHRGSLLLPNSTI